MRKQWVINPDVGFSKVLAEYGRFLEEDYKTAIGALQVPHAFEEYTEKTGRRFVIIGAVVFQLLLQRVCSYVLS